MARVTAPVSKLTRGLTSAPAAPRPAYVNNVSKASAQLARSESKGGGRIREPTEPSRRTMTTVHRPTPSPVPSKTRTNPLMQTFAFRTSSPATARLDTSTMDYAVMPSSATLFSEPSDDPFTRLRVPLLPDNFHPDRARAEGHSPEAPDAPLAAPEIVVLAAHPNNVVPSVLTEVEGMGIDGVELKFIHDGGPTKEAEPGMLRDLWKGLVDDVLGEKKPAV